MRKLLLLGIVLLLGLPFVLGDATVVFQPSVNDLSSDSLSCYSASSQNTGTWDCYFKYRGVATSGTEDLSKLSSLREEGYSFANFYDVSTGSPKLDYTVSGNCKVDFDANKKISTISALDDSCSFVLSPHLLSLGNMQVNFANGGGVDFTSKGSVIKKIASYDFTEYGVDGQECKAASRDHGENVEMSITYDYKDLTITSLNRDKNVFSLFGIPFVAVTSGDNVVFHLTKDPVEFEIHLDGDTGKPRDMAFTQDADLNDKVTADGYCGHFDDMSGIADGAEFAMVKTSDACARTPTCAYTQYIVSHSFYSQQNDYYSCQPDSSEGSIPIYYRAFGNSFKDLKCSYPSALSSTALSTLSCADGSTHCVDLSPVEATHFSLVTADRSEMVANINGLNHVYGNAVDDYVVSAEYLNVGGFTSFPEGEYEIAYSSSWYYVNPFSTVPSPHALVKAGATPRTTYDAQALSKDYVFLVDVRSGSLQFIYPYSDSHNDPSYYVALARDKDTCLLTASVCAGSIPGDKMIVIGNSSRASLFASLGNVPVYIAEVERDANPVPLAVSRVTEDDGSFVESIYLGNGDFSSISQKVSVKEGDTVSKIVMQHEDAGNGKTNFDLYMEKAKELRIISSYTSGEGDAQWVNIDSRKQAQIWKSMDSSFQRTVLSDTRRTLNANSEAVGGKDISYNGIKDDQSNIPIVSADLIVPIGMFNAPEVERFASAPQKGVADLGETFISGSSGLVLDASAPVRIADAPTLFQNSLGKSELDSRFADLEELPVSFDSKIIHSYFENCETIGKTNVDKSNYYTLCKPSSGGTYVHEYVQYTDDNGNLVSSLPRNRVLESPESAGASRAGQDLGFRSSYFNSIYDTLPNVIDKYNGDQFVAFLEGFSGLRCEDVGASYKVCQASDGTEFVAKYTDGTLDGPIKLLSSADESRR
ncbi:hypothetical protein HZA98_04010 [Candidatus Woesearchaeota archaeon]|nr:hypothetical protein [Candidatus Woesearchaeota archaeon]